MMFTYIKDTTVEESQLFLVKNYVRKQQETTGKKPAPFPLKTSLSAHVLRVKGLRFAPMNGKSSRP